MSDYIPPQYPLKCQRFQPGRRSDFITPDEVTERIQKAEEQLVGGDRRSARELLTELLGEAQRTFGNRHRVFRQVQTALAKADGGEQDA